MVHMRKINNKGFSLVEVIISIAILAIISIPLLNYFTDSIKYSALARTRQQATLEAQSIMEQLKAEDKLLKPDAVTGNYVSSYFNVKGIAPDVYNIVNTTGIGDVTYKCAAGTLSSQFDVEVKLETTSNYNEDPLPVIYGIDETRDVLAVETQQYTEAEAHFQTACAMAGRVIDIPANTTRTMHIEFKRDGAYINVKIYYVYCLTPDGSIPNYTSTPLADVNLATVKNLYLLFNRRQDNEQVVIKNDDAIPLPHMYFVDQKPAVDPGYSSYMTIKNLTLLEKNAYIIHTSFREDDIYDETGATGQIRCAELTTSEKPIRIVDIKVAVYPKGTFGGVSADEYVVMESTKGE